MGAWILAIVLGIWLGAIAAIDLKTLRIPDLLSLPLVGLGLTLAWFGGLTAFADHLIGAGVGFLVLALFGEIFFRLRGVEGLGLGDAKLFAAAGAWLGWRPLPLVLLMAATGGLIWAVWRGKKDEVAFGPWLALGFWLVLVSGL